MFSFFRDSVETVSHGAAPTLFMAFFVYVWLLWAAKALAARRYRPWTGPAPPLGTSVIAGTSHPFALPC